MGALTLYMYILTFNNGTKSVTTYMYDTNATSDQMIEVMCTDSMQFFRENDASQ